MNENNELLEYIYQTAEMGVFSTTKLIEDINGKENKIKKVIEGILKGYENFLKDSKKMLEKKKTEIKENSTFSKMGASMGIKKEVKEDNNNYIYEEYLGVLDIPKINFYKGFYSKTSSLNNVQFNLFVLKESDYPDVVNGNLIIAGHSGNYSNSYFNDLYKLSIDDTVTVHYQGKDN